MTQLPSLLRDVTSGVLTPQVEVRAHLPSTAPRVREPLPEAEPDTEDELSLDPWRPELLDAPAMAARLGGFMAAIGDVRKALFTAPGVSGKSIVFVGIWNVNERPGTGVVYRCQGQNPTAADPTRPTGKDIYGGLIPHRDYPQTGELLQRLLTAARPASEEEWLIPPEGGVIRKDKPWSPPKPKASRKKAAAPLI